MEFNNDKSIYVQIADFLCEQILKDELGIEERVPSVRDLASAIQVNPNTVMRTYSLLQDQGIFYNKRGIGYFVSDNAKTIVQRSKKEQFIQEQLPDIFKIMDLLNINFGELEELYQNYSNN